MEFQQLMKRAIEVRKQIEAKEQSQFGSAWNSEEITLGFVGDVGDLAKLTIAANGKRNIPNSREKLEHELADCLWSVIVLSHIHSIDLEESFVNTMNELEKRLSEKPL
jgi:NTP pyrophosphatase (non-canonical NTP hydrolase)